jgi:hypothetical protein
MKSKEKRNAPLSTYSVQSAKDLNKMNNRQTEYATEAERCPNETPARQLLSTEDITRSRIPGKPPKLIPSFRTALVHMLTGSLLSCARVQKPTLLSGWLPNPEAKRRTFRRFSRWVGPTNAFRSTTFDFFWLP